MKYLTLITLSFTTLLLASCGKKDKDNTDSFVCDMNTDFFPSYDSARIFIPNAFSPNGDGLNDVFRPICKNIQSIEWSVYDKEDHQIYATTNLTGAWDAANYLKTGIVLYHYKIKATSNEGNTYSKCGTVCTFACIQAGYSGVDTLVFADQYNAAMPDSYIKGASQENFVPCQ